MLCTRALTDPLRRRLSTARQSNLAENLSSFLRAHSHDSRGLSLSRTKRIKSKQNPEKTRSWVYTVHARTHAHPALDAAEKFSREMN